MRRIAATVPFVLAIACAPASTLLNPDLPAAPGWTLVAVTQEELARDSAASRHMRVTERDGTQHFLIGPHVERDSLIGECTERLPGGCRVAVALRNLRSLERQTTTGERATFNLNVLGLSLLATLLVVLAIRELIMHGA